MMLPTDMVLAKDKAFRRHVERYATDDKAFFDEFRDVFQKLLELGVPFQSGERISFKPSE
jgi:cytochrome c peroxidase